MTAETGIRIASGTLLVMGASILTVLFTAEPAGTARQPSPAVILQAAGSQSATPPGSLAPIGPPPSAPLHGPLALQQHGSTPARQHSLSAHSPALAADLAKALKSGNYADAAAGAIRIQEALHRDPGAMARQLLAALQAETGPLELDQLAGLLATCPLALADPAVLAALERLACRDPLAARRAAALSALAQAGDASDSLLATISARARQDLDPVVRMAAVGALAEQARRSAKRAAALNSRLLDLVPAEGEPAVRGAAVGALRPDALDARSHGRLCAILDSDPHMGVRQVAAEVLGDAPPELRQTTLTRLESALARETDYHLRRTLLTAVVRAGRQQAIAAMGRLARGSDPLAADAADYLAGLERGLVDMDKLWDFKQSRERDRLGPAAIPGDDALAHHD